MRKAMKEYLEACHRSTIRYAGKNPEARGAEVSEDRARRDLLNAHRKLAALLAMYLKPADTTLEDAVQEGVLALERVAEEGIGKIPLRLGPEIDRILNPGTA